jgi:hypothetical protein
MILKEQYGSCEMNNSGNNAILLQLGFDVSGPFADMLRLTYQRHAAYCRAYQIDFWQITGQLPHQLMPGAWSKIWLAQLCFKIGYEYIFWLDTDAAIVDFKTDLRDVFKEMGEASIGACEHNANKIPPHINVGVMYFRKTPQCVRFIDDWLKQFPGDKNWNEQGVFNHLRQEPQHQGVVAKIDDKWNATVNVNPHPNPVVKGWHGQGNGMIRLNLMRETCGLDYLNFGRV